MYGKLRIVFLVIFLMLTAEILTYIAICNLSFWQHSITNAYMPSSLIVMHVMVVFGLTLQCIPVEMNSVIFSGK